MSSTVSSATSSGGLLRLTGLASGLDVDSIVKQLMAAEKIPYTKLQQKQQKLEWTQDAYRDMSSLVLGFKTSFFDSLNLSSDMLSTNVYKQFNTTATNAVSSDTIQYVTATSNADASVGTHTISVSALAATAKIQGGTVSGVGLGASLTVPVNLASNNSITINGQTLTLSAKNYDGASGNTLTDLLTDIQSKINANSALVGKVTATLTSDNRIMMKSSDGSYISMSGSALSTLGFNSNTVRGTSMTAPVDLTSNNTLTIDGTDLILSAASYDNATSGQKFTDLVSDIQNKINASALNGKITASLSGNNLVISSTDGSNVTLSGDALSTLGLASATNGSTIKTITTSSTLSSLGVTDDNFNLAISISGATAANVFSTALPGSTTVASMMDSFNSSEVAQTNGLVMSFDSVNEKFKIESKNTGSNVDFSLSSDNYSKALGLTSGTAVTAQGKDAVVNIDGVTMTNSTNTIVANGVSYSLLKTTGASTVNVNTSQNIDAVVKQIQSFVSKYNDIISKISDKISEKYDSNYPPLTDDQKSSMNDTDITNWETKAKTGLLHNDDTLQSMLNDMRQALSNPVKGVNYTLANIGITTGGWYDGGKLNVDETKLRAALTNDLDGVTKLFSAESSVDYPLDSTDPNAAPDKVQQRYSENGVMYRLYDIINNNVNDLSINKGKLIQIAGEKGTTSEYDNDIYKQLTDISKEMTDMSEKLSDKETAYYNKFTTLETYMSNMNNQSSWLTTQLSKM